ncbi:hypothetical protein [Terrabacter sp. NPDC080008]|uniref:hypothetical protein n=1 Tax=Terrabacter sp. NPDC080008 TaxID=3155176 RepID=UPI00344C160F
MMTRLGGGPEIVETGNRPWDHDWRAGTVTAKSDFTDEEWTRIVRAPFVAGMAISLADPGGPIEAAKESMATLKSATNPPSREQLVAEVALEIQGMVQQRHNPVSGYKPTAGQPPGEQVLDELKAVQAIVASKATPEESAAFGQWLVAAAEAAAHAAKEGGFMGFKAQLVSEREQDMLDRVRSSVAG